MDASATVAGLDGRVVVHRDEWGIPHARATTWHDAFFAQGFAQAQDRLGQLEYERRRAVGRWAEVAGRPGLSFDRFARRADLAGAARREFADLDPTSQGVLAAYAAGVNAWLATAESLPPDLALVGVVPEPWEPWHCCAVFLARHVVFANWQLKLWRGRLAAALGADAAARVEGTGPAEVPLILPPGSVGPTAGPDAARLHAVVGAMAATLGSGSNAWALAGSRTESGRPLVAGDPHRLVETPNVYYQCHLACPDFDAIGLSFPGVPGFPHFGHNERVAWCVTNAMGDYQDLYVDYVDAAMLTGHEVIDVRDGDPVTVECQATSHGPVLFGDPATGAVVTLKSTALARPSRGLSVLLPMLQAGTVDELDDAMRRWVDPVNNLVSADVDGHVRYRTVGEIPVRPPAGAAPASAWGPVPGWTGDHEWAGTVPYDELPTARDPEVGWIVTANQEIVGPGFPHYLGSDYSRPHRARRIVDRLEALGPATVEDMAAIHQDRRSLAADLWVERLLDLEGHDDHERAALDHLRRWDRVMDAASVGAAVYLVTRDLVGQAVASHPALAPLQSPFPGEPSALYAPVELRLWRLLPGLLADDDPTLLPDGATWAGLLAGGLADAVRFLRRELGDDVDAWRWGALHRCAPHHPLSAVGVAGAAALDPPAVEVGGEWDTVWSTAHPAGYGFGVTTASVARYVYDLAAWDNSAWVVPLGASGDPTSRHFADQQRAWSRGELIPMRYSWDAIEATAATTTTLRPS
jgi:penicillin amidase